MTADPIERWHMLVKNRAIDQLDDLLAEEVVFHSPIVHTPQVGREISKLYLTAAVQVLGNDQFQYVRQIVGQQEAVLEFTTELEGIFINGIDLISWDEAGKIVEFKVMLRPLKAINLIHRLMAQMLAQFNPPPPDPNSD